MRSKGRVLIASLLCMLAAALYPMVTVAKERVHITAAESGLYDWENQIFEARGNVAVTSGDLSLEGNLLNMDLTTGEVWVQGDVKLRQGERELQGEVLVYNFETGQGSFEEARAEFILPEKTGSVFLKGQTIGIDEEKYTVQGAEFTTCDLAESHFHLATKELEYYPGEKVVIRGVTYYEGKVPLFYWPYVVIPLDLDDGFNRFTLPVFGYSEIEGYYMKNTFNYYFNSKSHGELYVDLFTRLGLGVGARHFYELEKLGKGSLYLYGIPTSSSPVLKGAFSHSWQNDNWSISTATNYEDSWVKHDLSTDNRLRLKLAKTDAEAWFKYSKNPAVTTSEKQEIGLTWAQSLTDSWRFNLKASMIEQSRNEVDTRVLDYLAETVYRYGQHTFTLAAQQQYNPDLLEGESPPWTSVQRIPEFKWTVSDLGIPKLPITTQLVLGRYGERPSTVTLNRAFGQLTLAQRSWRPTASTTFSYQGHAAGAIYGDQQKQGWLYGRVGVTQRLGTRLQFATTYSRRDVWGISPFRFDRQSPLQTLDLNLNYTTEPLRVIARTSYNLIKKEFSTLTIQTTWKPMENWSISARTDFDLNRKNMTNVIPTVQYKKEELELRLGMWYQPDRGELRRVEGEFVLPLDSWLISYDSVYEPPKQAFTKGKISVTKDFHCRKLSVSYDHVRNSVALQFTINAFPTLPLGWDSEGGLSLFDLEDVADLIGVEE